mgnify:FL=1|tara:strand:+ start:1825 stop:2373 length:549 start_codon:yes stop_codon:yes gene_type:complete
MNTKTANGILFIIAGIAPLIIYMGLGSEGSGLLDANLTEKLATWAMFCAPIAVMMTRDAIKGGEGFGVVNAGFLIMILAWPVGIVADSFNGAEMTDFADIIGEFGWSSMFLGLFVSGIGYYINKFFPIWLSILLCVVTAYGFIVLGFVDVTPDNEDALFLPMWLGFTLTIILLGIFRIRRES